MSLARTLAVMRKVTFLNVLGDEALKLLAFGSDPIRLRPRDTLFDAGEEADGAFLVLGGQLRLIPTAEAATPLVCSVGHLVDELALVVPRRRGATAIAQTSCEVVPLSRSQLLRILEEYPDAATRLQNALTKRTVELIDDVGKLRDRLK